MNAAIVGCGAIFDNHAKAISDNENVKLYAVCDNKADKAEAKAAEYNCIGYTDFNALLEDENVDVIHICTPHYLHAPMAVQALEHGKHVLMEKPMAMTAKEAQTIISAQKATGKSVGISFQNRYNETNLRIKELIESGKLGKVLGARASVCWKRDDNYYLQSDWRGKWATEGGGVLINQAIHTIDLLQWFLGEVDKVEASISTHKLKDIIEVEDTAEAYFTFKSGAEAIFYASNCNVTNSPVDIEIICENADIRMQDTLVVKYKSGEEEIVEEVNKKTGAKSYWGLGHAKLIDDFYRCLRNGERFPIGPEEAIKAVELIDKMRASC